MLETHIRPFGLTEPEFRVLTTLFSQPRGLGHPGDLCGLALQSPANMSRISDALVKRGLITRVGCVRDRRRLVMQITPDGERLVQQLLPALFAPMKDLLADVSEADQAALVAQLKHIGTLLFAALAPAAVDRDD